jgi:hypothetical protein
VTTTAYASLADLKTRLRLTTTDDDDELTRKLVVASRRIDKDCGGRSFCLDYTTSARVFPITSAQTLVVDDFASETGLVVGTGASTFSTVASTSYRVKPANAIIKGRAAWVLEARENVYCWPVDTGVDVQVTAQWGWPAIPDEIEEACLFMAQRLFKRKDSPEGVAGSTDFGLLRVIAKDPDYLGLIDDFVRPEV